MLKGQGGEGIKCPCQLCCFGRSPPTCSEININRSVSHMLPTHPCLKCHFSCCLFTQAALSLRVETSYHSPSGLSQLTSRALPFKPHWFSLWFLKPNAIEISLPVWTSWCEVLFLCPLPKCSFPSSYGQPLSTFLTFLNFQIHFTCVFSCGVCSARLQMALQFIDLDMDNTELQTGQDELRVFLLCHLPNFLLVLSIFYHVLLSSRFPVYWQQFQFWPKM